MKNCIVFGNCQRSFVMQYLVSSPAFNARYRLIDIPPVFLCRGDGLGRDHIKSCDLFIYQRVSEAFGRRLSTDYILSCLPESCQTLSIPNTYFTGYHPQYIPNPANRPDRRYSQEPGGKFPYGDKNIVRLLAEGKGKREIIETLADEDFYTYDFLAANLENTLRELTQREEGLDVSASDFIRANYRDNFLFYTVNHPSYLVTRHVARAVLRKLGLPDYEIANTVADFCRGHLHVPIYPSVKKHLGLTFLNKNHRYSHYYDFDGVWVTFKDYIARYIDYVKGY